MFFFVTPFIFGNGLKIPKSSKPPNLENYHIFRILRTSAFSQYIMTKGNWNGSTNPTAFFEVMTRTLGSRLQSRAFMHGCLKHQLFSNDLLCSTKIETLFSLSASDSPQIRFKTWQWPCYICCMSCIELGELLGLQAFCKLFWVARDVWVASSSFPALVLK